ncbi:MAG: hypothetical protein LBI86_11135 [Treponema sp.]|nr:hypothetical protein [Treponema sp.]
MPPPLGHNAWSFGVAKTPKAKSEGLCHAYAAWYNAYVKTFKPHTPAETAGARAAFNSSYKVLSRFIQVWIRGFPEIVTVEDLENLGIPPIDHTHTPVPRPKAQAEADLTFPGIHTVELRNIRTVAGTGDCCPALPDSLGVFAWQKLHTNRTWSFGYAETPKLSAGGG